MNNIRFSGIVLLFGSLCFILSAFAMPKIGRIYMEPSLEGRLQIVRTMPGAWTFHNIMYIIDSTLKNRHLQFLYQ